MDEQQQELAAFHAALSGEPTPAQTPDPAPAGSEVEVATEVQANQAAAQEPTQTPEEQQPEQAKTGGDEQPVQPLAEDDPEVFEGFKRSELKRLVAAASEVDQLKLQLRKANGKIGEINSRIQPAPSQAAVQQPSQPAELSPEMVQFEQDYPDVARYAKALVGTTSQPQAPAAPPAVEQQPMAVGEALAQAEPDPAAIEIAVLDRTNKGWREKVQSSPFGTWLASQGEEVHQAFHNADSADAVSEVIGKYDKWEADRQAAADKAVKGQQRLQRAVTPQGSTPRPQAALTEEEAFLLALKSK